MRIKTKKILSFLFILVLSILFISCDEKEEGPEKVNLDNVYLEIFEGVDLTNVTSNLTLPTKVGEVIVTWNSSNVEVLTNEGVVTRSDKDVTVTLTATLVYNDENKIYNENVTIKAKEEISQNPNFDEVFDSIFKNVDLTNVTSNLILPVKIDDVVIVWDSNNEEVLTNEGVVTRKEIDVTVTLKATLVYNSEVKAYNKTIIVKAIEKEEPNFDELFSSIFDSVDTLQVTKNLELPTKLEGVTIEWESSNPNVVSNTGVVTRIDKDITVTLTATLTYDRETVTKTQIIKVLAKENSGGKDEDEALAELEKALENFKNYDSWNFAVDFIISIDNETSSTYYEYLGYDCSLEYEYEGEIYKDFLVLGSDDLYKYYYMMSEDEYIIVSEDDEDFYYYCVVDYLDLSTILTTDFDYVDGCFKATDPQEIGKLIFGEYDGDTWEYVYVYLENEKISKITAASVYNDGFYDGYYEYELNFGSYGEITLELPKVNETPENPGGGEDPDNPGVGDSTSVTYLFASTSIQKGVELNAGTALTLFNDSTTSKIDLVSVETTKVYDGNGTGGAYANQGGFLKMGSSKVNGELKLQFANTFNVSKVEIVCQSWKSGSNDTISVNGSAAQTASDSGKTMLSFDLNGENYIEIVSNLRVFIFSIKVYFGEVELDIMEDQEVIQGSNETRLDDMLNEHDAVGLPSEGKYNVLVVPVEFSNTSISDADITKLDLAFNDKEGLTGWESVSSYYYKASYGKLDLSFDISNIYKSNKTSSYYNSLQYGEEAIMLEVLAYLEPLYDLNDYDYNSDGIIDGIYLIYSADVEYESDDSIYWAFVTWYITEDELSRQQFDGLDVYYYLFAGLDFMDEDAKDSSDGFEYNGYIDGLKVNAGTYIHETGHMLGLDDYYDYDTSAGSGEGVGGADMMDYTVGDHSSYSKTILDWVTPTIVTEDTTITIESFEKSGDCIMILLDSNGSYFSEYLLIDLYTNTGLNEMHSSLSNSLLYDGAEYGARVYHVSSWITNPFNDDYQSLTDNNNTLTNDELIKLVEADGENNFNSSDGFAMSSDLWQTGDVFSEMFSMYTRNDGKLINFDISFDSVTSENATITIKFK